MTDRERGPDNNRGNIAAFVAVAVVAVALFLVFNAIQKHNALQNCIDSGRRDCVPIPSVTTP